MTDLTLTLTLTDWTHVHTWHESHGDHRTDFYQKAPKLNEWSPRRVEVLAVSTYYDGRPSHVRIETDRDYLMARDIRANPSRYPRAGERHVSPCCTAGHDDFEDADTGQRWRVYGVAGHGEWAFKLDDED